MKLPLVVPLLVSVLAVFTAVDCLTFPVGPEDEELYPDDGIQTLEDTFPDIQEPYLPDSGGERPFDDGKSALERGGGSCFPTISCVLAGGHCFKFREGCTGTIDPHGCSGGRRCNCKCCIPVPTVYVSINTIINSSDPDGSTDRHPKNAIDGDTASFWNPFGGGRYYNNWFIIFELAKRYTVTGTKLINYGDKAHDVTKFQIEASDDQVNWYKGGRANNVKTGTDDWQSFDNLKPTTGKYLRFTVRETYEGYQPWLKEVSFTGYSDEEIGCPKGTFLFPSTQQCFRLFNDQKLNWTDAASKCELHSLALAKPYDALALRSYMVQRFGPDTRAWIGARGDNTMFRWQDDQELSNDSPLWWSGQPGVYVDTEHCLEFLTSTATWKSNPDQPFYSLRCLNLKYTLCEGTMAQSSSVKRKVSDRCYN